MTDTRNSVATYGFGDRFELKWINVDDIGNKTFTVTITYADMAPVYSLNDDAEIPREVLYFTEAKKGLVLNQSNFQVMVQAFGRNHNGWVNKQIELYVDWSIRNPSNPNKPGGVRIKVPGVSQVIPPRAGPTPQPQAVPTGINPYAAASQPARPQEPDIRANPESRGNTAKELNDDIPF